MLSETLDNLTRRIAKELDHLSPQPSSADGPHRGTEVATTAKSATASPVASAKETPTVSASEPSRSTASTHLESNLAKTPDSKPFSDDAEASSPAKMERRPAKAKRPTGKAEGSATGGSEDATDASTPQDWRRIHIN